MALNLDMVGKPIGPLTREYSWKDAVLYGLAVGAGFSELDFCYEPRLKVIPTFATAAIFDFFWRVGAASGADPTGVLHGEQDITFHHPVPPEGTLTTNGAISGLYDKGKNKGAIIVADSETRHSNGNILCNTRFTIFARKDGGFGGEKKSGPVTAFPSGDPDIVVEDRPAENQPLLYRLTGDLFPLHADPEFAKAAGFNRPIMHGMGTLGFACRALVGALTPCAPERVRRLACRFTRPLYPGIAIATRIWKTGDGHALWKTVNTETGETVLDNGRFEFELPRQPGVSGSSGDDRSALQETIQATVSQLAQRMDLGRFAGREMRYQFRLTDMPHPDWQLLIDGNGCQFLEGKTDASDCTLVLSGADFNRLLNGKLNPVAAYTEGRVQVEGNLSNAALLMELLPMG